MHGLITIMHIGKSSTGLPRLQPGIIFRFIIRIEFYKNIILYKVCSLRATYNGPGSFYKLDRPGLEQGHPT